MTEQKTDRPLDAKLAEASDEQAKTRRASRHHAGQVHRPGRQDQFRARAAGSQFIGRSNAGKSSLINSLTRIRGLARVSSQPGKTQTINFFELIKLRDPESGRSRVQGLYSVDLPGYGYAKRARSAARSGRSSSTSTC